MRNLIIRDPSSDDMATVGSIDSKPRPQAAAHRAVVLRNSWRRADTSWQQWQEQLAEAMKERIWEEYPKESPAGNLTSLLEQLDIDPNFALSREKFSDRPIRGPGRPPKAENLDNCQGFTAEEMGGGNSADYLKARMARDKPEILRQFNAGEIRSVRQAAIKAGIVNAKTRYSLPDDPIAAGRYLAQRVDKDWLLSMVDEYMKAIEA